MSCPTRVIETGRIEPLKTGGPSTLLRFGGDDRVFRDFGDGTFDDAFPEFQGAIRFHPGNHEPSSAIRHLALCWLGHCGG